MSENKVIPTFTVVNAEIPDIDITTYYADDSYGEIYLTFINDLYESTSGSPILEGDLVAIGSDQFLTSIDLEIDVDGNLLAMGDEANRYNINENGELTYTT